MVENAKIKKFKCDILSNFQTMCNGKHYIKLVWFQNLFFLSQQRIDKRKSKYVLLFNKNCIISQGPVFRKMQLFHLQWRTLVIFLQAFPLLSCWTVALPISQKVNQSTSWKLHLNPRAHTSWLTIVRKWFLTMNEMKERLFREKKCHFWNDVNWKIGEWMVSPFLPYRHSVWKSHKMSHLNFSILAFSTNFWPIKTDLSGNTVWQQASDLQKLAKMDNFWHF